jgi:hypothetical protein
VPCDLNFNSNSFLILESIHFDACVRTPIYAYKCAQLNSHLWRSCWAGIFVNLQDFSHKVWTPLKFIEFQIATCSRNYSINSIENLKSTQLIKLFIIFQPSPIQSLSIFGAREDQVLYFTNQSKFELIENRWFKPIELGPRATVARVGLNRPRPRLSVALG